MSVVALGSVKASPGVTTTLLALAAVWPADRQLLLIEADPDGGDLAARAGLANEPGLTSLAAAGRRALTASEIDQHVQAIPGGTELVVAPADAEQATHALEILGDRLPSLLAELTDRDVVVDCGRLRPHSPASALFNHADAALLVARPRLDELHHLHARIDQLTTDTPRTELLLIGDEPYPAHEVTSALGLPVIGVLPRDPAAADALNGLTRNPVALRRSALLRHAREIADALIEHLTPTPEAARERFVSGTAPPSIGSDTGEGSVRTDGHRVSSGWAEVLQRTIPTPTSRTSPTPPPAGTGR